ncbi:MAG TPA: hypothetical protein VN636_15575, partial [Acidimicrobiia bacterium]|nr:hypothetical protein [Acidimicrobiia bacterium]
MRRRAFLRSIAAIGMCSPLLAAAGCATGSAASSKGTAPHTSTCALVAHLDDIASGIGRADVSDPTKFTHQLDDAVGEYVTTLRQLSAQAPARLRPGLDRVSADVQQYRFADARTDRADL